MRQITIEPYHRSKFVVVYDGLEVGDFDNLHDALEQSQRLARFELNLETWEQERELNKEKVHEHRN